MVLSRVLGGLGRFFISLGVLTLLFVAYQLWGTGLLTAQAQNGLENDFEDLLAEAGVVPDDTAAPETTETTGSSEVPTAEVEAEPELSPAERRQLARLLWQPSGEPVAQILAPDIDLDWLVVAGTTKDDLAKGPGHYDNTPLPGMPGNASVAGHRTTYGAPFNRLDELDPGDRITVRTVQGTFVYEVVEQDSGKGYFIVSPDRVDVLGQDFEAAPNRLTLTACHPKFSAAQRIIVVAELVGEPAPYIAPPRGRGSGPATLANEDEVDETATVSTETTATVTASVVETASSAEAETAIETTTATDESVSTGAGPSTPLDPTVGLTVATESEDFGEGLNGDRDAILPSITWGVAALAIWATAAFTATRWRRWPAYAAALAPFAAVLFVCFFHIDKAIPSY